MKYDVRDHKKEVNWGLHLAGLLVVVVALALYHYLIQKELVAQRERSEQRIAQLSLLLKQAPAIQKEHRRLKEELDALAESIQVVRERLPQDLGEDSFSQELRQVAAKVGVAEIELDWSPPDITPHHAQASANLTGFGSFASICRFLDEVRQIPRITEIAQLKLDSDQNSSEHPFQITLVLYYGLDSDESNKNGGVL